MEARRLGKIVRHSTFQSEAPSRWAASMSVFGNALKVLNNCITAKAEAILGTIRPISVSRQPKLLIMM
ncbi:hypothetical protein D3C75_1200540 [compost metagenome]